MRSSRKVQQTTSAKVLQNAQSFRESIQFQCLSIQMNCIARVQKEAPEEAEQMDTMCIYLRMNDVQVQVETKGLCLPISAEWQWRCLLNCIRPGLSTRCHT